LIVLAGAQEARMTESKDTRQCPGCSESIKHASLVVLHAGQFFHHWCVAQIVQIDDPIHDFLRRHYPSGFCADCLSAAFDLTHEQAQKFFRAPRADRALVILLGARCAQCQESRMTVQAVGYDQTHQELRLPARRRPRPRDPTDGTAGV
jgi:hypothetical protein